MGPHHCLEAAVVGIDCSLMLSLIIRTRLELVTKLFFPKKIECYVYTFMGRVNSNCAHTRITCNSECANKGLTRFHFFVLADSSSAQKKGPVDQKKNSDAGISDKF